MPQKILVKEKKKEHEEADSNGGNIDDDFEKKLHLPDIFHSISPIWTCERILGVFRFSFDGEKLVPVHWAKRVVLVLVAIMIAGIYYSSTDLPADLSGTQKLVDVMDEIPSTAIVAQAIATILTTACFFNNRNIMIIESFSEIDCLLRVNIKGDYYKNCRKNVIYNLSAFVLVHIIFIIVNFLQTINTMVSSFAVLLCYVQQNIEVFLIVCYITLLRSKLLLINDYLTKFVYEKNKNKVSMFDVREEYNKIKKGQILSKDVKIRDLASIYDLIGSSCSMIDNAFKFQIFIVLVSTFLYIVITIWTTLFYFRSQDVVSASMVKIIVSCLMNLNVVVMLSVCCERLILTRKETKVLVNEVIMDYELPKSTRVEAKTFMKLVDAWPLRIYVYDMFSVDISLLLKFVSVATTYLIVIIQVSHFV